MFKVTFKMQQQPLHLLLKHHFLSHKTVFPKLNAGWGGFPGKVSQILDRLGKLQQLSVACSSSPCHLRRCLHVGPHALEASAVDRPQEIQSFQSERKYAERRRLKNHVTEI